MFDKIIAYSIKNKFVVGLLVIVLMVWGGFSLSQLPIDAVPDITNNQVQVITISPNLATQEIEQFITTPVELALQNIQQLVEIRSISRFGLSVVTVVFEEDMDVYLARQLVSEYLKEAEDHIPMNLGTPTMAPISTGLGEIYQYVIRNEEGAKHNYSPTELRSIQDWIVKRQLSGIEGVVEINTMGGFLKQYEVAINPNLLKSMSLSIQDVFAALENSNENTGGAYIEKNPNTYYIRTDGIARSLNDLAHIVIAVRNGRPILVKDVAQVQFGKAPRYGALVRNGAEAVGGRVMMLKGANSAAVTERVKERVKQIEKSLPEGVIIEPYLVRDKLVSTAIGTVRTNLIEGGLIVVFILVIMLGNWRAGLIVASVIPLAMLFAVAMMNVLGISANLMSLGAIDFGLVVDGAVIIVEAIVHRFQAKFAGQQLTAKQMDEEVQTAAQQIRSSAAFGEIIILMVYIPILALVGIEGKMFKPMAQTVMLAIGGALILSLTYVPMMSALLLNRNIEFKTTIADRIINFMHWLYDPILQFALQFKRTVVLATCLLFIGSLLVFSRMGGEFIPTLEEGDLAMQQILPPGTSLTQSIEVAKKIQTILLDEFPEIEDVVTYIGAAEIPTDPMPVEIGDYTIIMKPKEEWTSARTRNEMFQQIDKALAVVPGVGKEFSQPIQLRFNELMTGSKADITVKLYGQDLAVLYSKAKEAEAVIRQLQGVGSVNVEQTVGMPQLVIRFNYNKMAQYGLQVKEVNRVVRSAFAGEKAGIIYEGERRFDLVVRLDEQFRTGIEDVKTLYIPLDNGNQVPLTEVAQVALMDSPMQISRDNTNRRIVIGVNVGNTDVETLVYQIEQALDANIKLPSGYYFTYGGQFENLKAANARLRIAVPIALTLIYILLYFTFGSLAQATLIFTAIPLSAIGGIWALQLRGMPFSISAGIGFIALFGVAVLNGIVLIGYFNQLKKEGIQNINERILKGTYVRLRPVLMTASVASLGFLPMALSTSGGAEVQRPLATVVIGGLITATFLTLVVLPILYSWLANWQEQRTRNKTFGKVLMLGFIFCVIGVNQTHAQKAISMDEAVEMALSNHPTMQAATLQVQQGKVLEDLSYSLGPTQFSYQGNGLFRENNQQMNQYFFVQNVPNPAKTKALRTLGTAKAGQFTLQKQLLEQELIMDVKQVYLELQQRKALAQLYHQLAQTYQSYLAMAKKRVQVGEANRMELLSFQSSVNEQQLRLEQTKLEISNLETKLSQLVVSEVLVTSADSLTAMPFTLADTAQTLQWKLAQQEIQLAKANTDVLKASKKPDLQFGYAVQNFVEVGWLNGLQLDVQIPLFNKQTNQKIEAQQLQVAVAKAKLKAKQLQVQQALITASNAIQLYAKGMEFYRNQLETINPEMDRISRLNYQAGEISYLELLNTLTLRSNNHKSYLEQILFYNKAVVFYQFLSN
ncbi:MAG: CusA/CzcA family heavy metal efflux RND transporter [Flammeovirgaceae bacterium]